MKKITDYVFFLLGGFLPYLFVMGCWFGTFCSFDYVSTVKHPMFYILAIMYWLIFISYQLDRRLS